MASVIVIKEMVASVEEILPPPYLDLPTQAQMPPYVQSLLRMYEFSSNKSFKTDQRLTGGSSQSPIGYYTDGSECMGEPGKLRLGHTVFFA